MTIIVNGDSAVKILRHALIVPRNMAKSPDDTTWRTHSCERHDVDSAGFLAGETWPGQHFRATEAFGTNSDEVSV